MAKFFRQPQVNGSPEYIFFCPGCKCDHGIWVTPSEFNGCVWEFNHDVDNPTVHPSVRVAHGKNQLCHSFIREGKIQFLTDSTHELAGRTVEIPDYSL